MSLQSFNRFHNEVFNLPRDSFSNFDILKVKSLGEYLYSVKNSFSIEGLTLSEIYVELHFFLQNNTIENPNADFEALFDFELTEINDVKANYRDTQGRKFRHWMELASLLELLSNKEFGNNRSRRVLSSFTEEIFLIPNSVLRTFLRDKILSINTLNSSGLSNLNSFELYRNLNFRPAMAILKYLYILNRPCTRFELSIFFGRPDYSLDSEDEIIENAVSIGRDFPPNREEQIQVFFERMGWKDEQGNYYSYSASQQPYFKFNAFFILMDAVGLINYDVNNSLILLSEFSSSLFSSETLPETVELESLLNEVEQLDTEEDIAGKVTKNRAELIAELLEADKDFLNEANKKASLKSGTVQVSTQSERLRRDELIREISKQKASYVCQGCNQETFIDKNGNNFVESHHIIEYNTKEEGPDILQNLLVLCPNCHSRIHFARIDIVEQFYSRLRETNAITLDQFKEIHTKLNMLRTKHIEILLKKNIISEEESTELLELIAE